MNTPHDQANTPHPPADSPAARRLSRDAFDPQLWAVRQTQVANLLPGNFADNILRDIRLSKKSETDALSLHTKTWRFFHNPFTLSALTACICLAAAILIHIQSVSQTNEENLVGWRGVAEQAATLDPY